MCLGRLILGLYLRGRRHPLEVTLAQFIQPCYVSVTPGVELMQPGGTGYRDTDTTISMRLLSGHAPSHLLPITLQILQIALTPSRKVMKYKSWSGPIKSSPARLYLRVLL